MQLFIKSDRTHVLDVEEGSTVGDVRSFICETEGLPETEVRFIF